jgi:hypothetical protein
MSDAAIISGVFVDFRTLPSRSVARITVEIAIETANEALAKLGGFPLPSETRWVAVALLGPETAPWPVAPADETASKADAEADLPGRSPWRDIKSSQQAGMLCADPDFIAWLQVEGPASAADEVRKRCGVTSRSELDRDPDAAAAWIRLSSQFFGRNEAAPLEQSRMNGRH